MLCSVIQILYSIENIYGLTRTLHDLEFACDKDGNKLYFVGNSAVIFKVMRNGKPYSMKCYSRKNPNLREIYSSRLFEEELCIYLGSNQTHWIDVILEPWIEGITLDEAIKTAIQDNDTQALQSLSRAFDSLALEMLASPTAHGDLSPDNILLNSQTGALHLIDFDAQYTPSMQGQQALELGTRAYQHPSRSIEHFGSYIDDYPIALISTAIAAIAIDPTIYSRHPNHEGLIFYPEQLISNSSAALDEALKIFARHADAAAYHIATLLRSQNIELKNLKQCIKFKIQPNHPETLLSLQADSSHWGYTQSNGEWAIPPIYDLAFDFSEGYAVVKIGDCYHYIDACGTIAMNCSDAENIKSIKNGYARIKRDGEWMETPMAQ